LLFLFTEIRPSKYLPKESALNFASKFPFLSKKSQSVGFNSVFIAKNSFLKYLISPILTSP